MCDPPWDSNTGDVRKSYHDGVRPDHTAFASIAREKALAQSPTLCCPSCAKPVTELDSARERYTRPDGVEVSPPLRIALHPCGCAVPPEWAGAFTAEINRRMDGATPSAVSVKPADPTQAAKLEAKILTIAAEREAAAGEARRRLEYYLVIAVDELVRLLPGAESRMPQVDALDHEVEAWAEKNKMNIPPVAAKKTREFGYPAGYPNPLAPKPAGAGVVNLCGPGTADKLKTEASLLAKEEALHLDPKVAAAGKEQLQRQRTAAQIVKLGGMLSRKTLAEMFDLDLSEEQATTAKEIAADYKQAQKREDGFYRRLMPEAAATDPALLAAARKFMDQHNTLCLQLVNEQLLGQPHHDTRQAAAHLVAIKANIDRHLKDGTVMSAEALLILALVVPVFLPAAGMVPTRPGPAPGLPLPVTTAELKDEFHDRFAPVRRRIIPRKAGDG